MIGSFDDGDDMLWGGLDAPRAKLTSVRSGTFDPEHNRVGGMLFAALVDCLNEKREVTIIDWRRR